MKSLKYIIDGSFAKLQTKVKPALVCSNHFVHVYQYICVPYYHPIPFYLCTCYYFLVGSNPFVHVCLHVCRCVFIPGVPSSISSCAPMHHCFYVSMCVSCSVSKPFYVWFHAYVYVHTYECVSSGVKPVVRWLFRKTIHWSKTKLKWNQPKASVIKPPTRLNQPWRVICKSTP